MTAAAPESVAVSLWNRIVDLGGDDGADLDRINWQLRGLARQRPGDFIVRLAAARGLLARGLREDAQSHLDAAWSLRNGLPAVHVGNLAAVCLECGRLADARELTEALLAGGAANGDRQLFNLAVQLALRTGEVASAIAAEVATGLHDEGMQGFIDELERTNLAEAFREHQRIIEAAIGPHSCGFRADISVDEAGDLGAHLVYHTDVSDSERFTVYDTLAERIEDGALIAVSHLVSIGIEGPKVVRTEDAA